MSIGGVLTFRSQTGTPSVGLNREINGSGEIIFILGGPSTVAPQITFNHTGTLPASPVELHVGAGIAIRGGTSPASIGQGALRFAQTAPQSLLGNGQIILLTPGDGTAGSGSEIRQVGGNVLTVGPGITTQWRGLSRLSLRESSESAIHWLPDALKTGPKLLRIIR